MASALTAAGLEEARTRDRLVALQRRIDHDAPQQTLVAYVQECAVRVVRERQAAFDAEWAAIRQIAITRVCR